MAVRGGGRLLAHLRKLQQMPSQVKGRVGFTGRQIATLASTHEFGSPKANIPERPAFRRGIRQAEETVKEEMRKTQAEDLTPERVGEVMEMARDIVRAEYLDHNSVPLSERQARRKRGTSGAGRQLVGTKGPRLAGHLKAFVGDDEV